MPKTVGEEQVNEIGDAQVETNNQNIGSHTKNEVKGVSQTIVSFLKIKGDSMGHLENS